MTSKEFVTRLAAGVLVMLAIAWTTVNVGRAVAAGRRVPTQPYALVANPDQLAGSGHRLGNSSASTLIVVFSDYECGACRDLFARLAPLLEEHDSLGAVVRHFPVHPNASQAAVAAECAAKAGRFGEYHQVLFADQARIAEADWKLFARRAGIRDQTAFEACIAYGDASVVVRQDIGAAESLAVPMTPIVVVGHDVYAGLPWDFEAIVRRHLAMASQE